MMTSTTPSIPDVILEQYALAELPLAEMKRIDDLIEHDNKLAARLERLYESNTAILAETPPAEFTAMVNKRLENTEESSFSSNRQTATTPQRQNRNPFRLVILAPAMAAVAVLLFFVVNPDIFSRSEIVSVPGQTVSSGGDYIGLKGDAQLQIYRQNGFDAELLDETSTVENRDILQISYCARGQSHGVIFSIDGHRAVTLHFPELRDGSTLLDQTGEVPIPHAYEIDDAPDFERFFLVTSKTRIPVDEILSSGRELASNQDELCEYMLKLSDQYKQTSIMIRKKESK